MTPEELKALENRASEVYADVMKKVNQAQKYLAFFESQRKNYDTRIRVLENKERDLEARYTQLKYAQLRFNKKVSESNLDKEVQELILTGSNGANG